MNKTLPWAQRYALIIVACAIPRLAYVWLRPPDPGWGAHYWPLATSLISRGILGYEGVPSTYYEPLYPLFLAFARQITADHLFLVLALQALVGSIGGIYLYELALTLDRTVRTATIAVALYAFYPYLVAQSAALEEVSLLTTALIASAYYYSRAGDGAHSLACGVAFGLALLTRVTVAPMVAIAVLALAFRKRYSIAIAIGGIAVVLYLPYALRNYRIDGSILPSRGGFSLFKANCRYSDQVIPAYMVDVLNAYARQVAVAGLPNFNRATEREIDRFYVSQALYFMKRHPGRFLLRSTRHAAYLFYPRLVPFHPVGSATRTRFTGDDRIIVENPAHRRLIDELAYTLSYTPLLVAALVGAYMRRRDIERDLILHAIVCCFIVVYSISWPATRLRAPMDFVLMFYAACAIRRMVPGTVTNAAIT